MLCGLPGVFLIGSIMNGQNLNVSNSLQVRPSAKVCFRDKLYLNLRENGSHLDLDNLQIGPLTKAFNQTISLMVVNVFGLLLET